MSVSSDLTSPAIDAPSNDAPLRRTSFKFVDGYGEPLQGSQNVCEPESNEFDVVLMGSEKDKLLCLFVEPRHRHFRRLSHLIENGSGNASPTDLPGWRLVQIVVDFEDA